LRKRDQVVGSRFERALQEPVRRAAVKRHDWPIVPLAGGVADQLERLFALIRAPDDHQVGSLLEFDSGAVVRVGERDEPYGHARWERPADRPGVEARLECNEDLQSLRVHRFPPTA
jgi:hypothetical protein